MAVINRAAKAKRSRIRKHPVQAEHDDWVERDWPDSPVPKQIPTAPVRLFDTGATRDTTDGKIDYAKILDPSTVKRFGQYMREHSVQSDGSIRAYDNWKKGIPLDAYMQSLFRHVVDLWDDHELGGRQTCDEQWRKEIEDALCAIIFNAQGYLYELLLKQ